MRGDINDAGFKVGDRVRNILVGGDAFGTIMGKSSVMGKSWRVKFDRNGAVVNQHEKFLKKI
jgi:hypothetical protein